MATKDREELLAEFLLRLGNAKPASDSDGAFCLLSNMLTSVEDEHSGVPNDPSRWREDGRLYPPQADREIRSPVNGTRCYRTAGHRLVFGENGAIAILDGDDVWIFQKPGRDGIKIK